WRAGRAGSVAGIRPPSWGRIARVDPGRSGRRTGRNHAVLLGLDRYRRNPGREPFLTVRQRPAGRAVERALTPPPPGSGAGHATCPWCRVDLTAQAPVALDGAVLVCDSCLRELPATDEVARACAAVIEVLRPRLVAAALAFAGEPDLQPLPVQLA